jgi:hypothetical protein
MRLEFNILWVEDQPAEVKAQRDRIELQMRKEGFKLQTHFATSIEEAQNYVANDVFEDHIDLILMDFDFGDGPNGGEGLEMIRDRIPFKDIVFYSARVPQNLKKLVAESEVSGVFCSSRLDLPDTVIGVFEVLVKKVLDIDHSRGIVMGATSEIDGFVNEALLKVFAQADEDSRSIALKVVAKQLADIRKRFEKDFEKIQGSTEISDLITFHNIYSSAHRLKLFRKLLESLGILENERQVMLSYAKDTMPKRNDLAHVTVKRSGFSRKIFDRNGTELTADDMRALRLALLEHHEMFEKVTANLSQE